MPELKTIDHLICQDLKQRTELGVTRYGSPLRPCAGQGSAQDLYEELLDAVQYGKKHLLEIEDLYSRLTMLRMLIESKQVSECDTIEALKIAEEICGAWLTPAVKGVVK